MQDLTLDPPVDGVAQLTQQWLNTNVRNALYLVLSPPTAILQKTTAQTYAASNTWSAVEFDIVLADTEDPATPLFPASSSTWDFETGTSSWTVNNGSVAANTVNYYDGVQSLKWTPVGSGSFAATSPLNVRTAAPGNYGRAALWVFTEAAETVNIHHQWRTSGGVLLSGETVSSNVVTVANTWTKLEVFSGTIAPATTAFASIALGAPSCTSADRYYIDSVQLDTYTNPTRLRVTTPGWYEAIATVPMVIDNAFNSFALAFRKNGTDYYAGDCVNWNVGTSPRLITNFCTIISMAANDYLETMVRMSRAVTLPATFAAMTPRWTLRRVRGI